MLDNVQYLILGDGDGSTLAVLGNVAKGRRHLLQMVDNAMIRSKTCLVVLVTGRPTPCHAGKVAHGSCAARCEEVLNLVRTDDDCLF